MALYVFIYRINKWKKTLRPEDDSRILTVWMVVFLLFVVIRLPRFDKTILLSPFIEYPSQKLNSPYNTLITVRHFVVESVLQNISVIFDHIYTVFHNILCEYDDIIYFNVTSLYFFECSVVRKHEKFSLFEWIKVTLDRQ